jgi:hypothetical protein
MISVQKYFGLAVLALAFVGCASTPKQSDERTPASSRQIDARSMGWCGGYFTLNEYPDPQNPGNMNLSIQFRDVNTNNCANMTVRDATSQRQIQRYDLQSSGNYTLSHKQLDALSDDCRISFDFPGMSGDFEVYYPNCRLGRQRYDDNAPQQGRSSNTDLSYERSNKGNCKIMKNGTYTNQNTSDASFCDGAGNGERVSYEWSNKNNCKRMINSQYSSNVDDHYCTQRHGQ